jgi:2-polyprenyl-3-methyl-5-hydroxy-6-metoxy-1,4-benzoquinol methylase
MSAPCLLCGGTESRALFVKGGKTFVRCSGCDLEWLEPMPTSAEIDAYYEWAYREGIYAPYAEADDIRRLIAEHRLSVVQPRARAGRWLDVGCATGHFVEAARRAGQAAEGLDVSPGAVERARARGLTAHLGRVEDFRPDAPYDTITAFDVIEHLLDPRGFLDRLRSWLVPGGTLALTLPDVGSIYPRLLMRRHWFYYLPSDHLYYFNPRTIARLLAEQRFTVQRVMPAYKPLTIRYIVPQLRIFNPLLGRVAGLLARTVPERLTSRPWRCYIGEMMALAARADTPSNKRLDSGETSVLLRS